MYVYIGYNTEKSIINKFECMQMRTQRKTDPVVLVRILKENNTKYDNNELILIII